ncbi:MAG: fluoride efflux transporter FluC [Hyphomicrobium sp.]
MNLLFLACAGGALGAGARFLVNQAFAAPAVARGVAVFPWPTMIVNVVGGFLMGVVVVLVNERLGGAPEWRTFLATGILGGFTTFSAFSLDMMHLMSDGGALSVRFLAYTVGSVVLAFAALLSGLCVARAVLT